MAANNEDMRMAEQMEEIIKSWMLLPKEKQQSLPNQDKTRKAQFTGEAFAGRILGKMVGQNLDFGAIRWRLTQFGKYLADGKDLTNFFAKLTYLDDDQKTKFKGILQRNNHDNPWAGAPVPQDAQPAAAANPQDAQPAVVPGVVAQPVQAAGIGQSGDSSDSDDDAYDFIDSDTWSKGIPSVQPPPRNARFASKEETAALLARGFTRCRGDKDGFPVIGAGGFGVVVRASHPKSGLVRAVKIVKLGIDAFGRPATPAMVNRKIDAIENEARALQLARHPNVVAYVQHWVPPKRDQQAFGDAQKQVKTATKKFRKAQRKAFMAKQQAEEAKQKAKAARRKSAQARAAEARKVTKAALADALKAVQDAANELTAAETAMAVEDRKASSFKSQCGLICMELVPGGTLWDYVKSNQLDEDTTRKIFGDLAAVLKHLHGLPLPLFHRDLKLDNVFVETTTPVTIKLGDFGAATNDTNAPIFATFRYAPAETIKRKLKDPASPDTDAAGTDVYGLGVMGYMMLAKEHPFDCDEERKIAWGDFPPRYKHFGQTLVRDFILQKQQRDPHFPPPLLEDRFRDARNLFIAMLNADPTKRLSLDQVLQHPWLKIKNEAD